MYVAVKGGETAIAHSLDLVADKRRGDRDVPELSLAQIDQQLWPVAFQWRDAELTPAALLQARPVT